MSSTDSTIRSVSMLPTPISVEDAALHVVGGPHKGKVQQLNKELILIGRAEWCDLVLDQDPKVSSRHCQIVLEPYGACVLDNDSSNGTFLAGQQIIQAYLKPGVTLCIGDSTLELVIKTDKKKKIIPRHQDDSGELVGKSSQMRQLFHWMERIAPRDASVLLTGETGTGKTHIAQSIHRQSGRTGPFVEVNCGALSANLIEGLLFGYEKGAFTGASKAHDGYFAQADEGTLFLDEIGELPIELQPKLLQVIESHTFRKLGDKKDRHSNFRLITATHRDLQEAIEEDLFRQDLYFRINVIKLEVPPLRDRAEDIPLLCAAILRKLPGGEHFELTTEAYRKLQSYVWPGNVRELRSLLERCVVLLDSKTIDADDLFFDFDNEALNVSHTPPSPLQEKSPSVNIESLLEASQDQPLSIEQVMAILVQELPGETLDDFMGRVEASFLQHVLNRTGSVQEAAKHLGVSRGLIYKRVHKYDLEIP